MHFVTSAAFCDIIHVFSNKAAATFCNKILQSFVIKRISCFVIKLDAFCDKRSITQCIWGQKLYACDM